MGTDVISHGGAADALKRIGGASVAAVGTKASRLSGEHAARGELNTGSAPPFRALLEPPGQSSDLPLPVVPGYEILGELGRGGMGIVYQARQCSLKRLVALKMILAGSHAHASACPRFRTEAEAVARLHHTNVVHIHEVGEHQGRPFLSLEFVEGGNLLQKIAGIAQPERFAAQLVETLAKAVHYTHQRGILHRDLKPTNVLLTADGTPKIADFGLAKVLDAEVDRTRSETLVGTPSYMAPEQAAGDTNQVGAAADVYALGAILYELLTGRPPFQDATPLKTLERVRTQDPPPPRRSRQSLSRDLETICLKCLEKEPAKRYASAEALADDLRCFLEARPIQARPVPIWQHLWKSARRHPAMAACALATVAVLGLLLIAWLYFRAEDQLAVHNAEEKYRQFVQSRNEALFYGLIAREEGAMLLGADATTNLQKAESAIRTALSLAGVGADSETQSKYAGFPAGRQSDIAADCYTLLVVLANVQSQQCGPGSKEGPQDGLRTLERARDVGLRTRAFHLRRSSFLEQLGEREQAKKEREQAATLPMHSALDYFLVGEEQYRRREWPQAMNSFNRAISLQPGHFWAQFFLAVAQLKVQQWEAAKAGFNACLTQQPDFVWLYVFRSFANERLQALEEARMDFDRALKLNPNQDARYVLFLSRGILRFNQKELTRAEADFRSALALKPHQYNAYLNLAQVYLAQGKFQAAAEQVETALRFQPPREVMAGYHLERGRNLLRHNRTEQAIEECAAALKHVPQQALPHEVCGRALLALGRYEQAEQSFDHYLRNRGDKTSDVFRGRGLARMKLGKYPEAVEDYTRALELAADADIYEHRGWAHFFADASKLALRDFSKAIELNPDAGDAYVGRGLARVMLGDHRQAIADAETARRHKPATAEMMHNIACIFAQAVARTEADSQEKDWQALTAGYRSRALEAVRQTLAMLPPEDRVSFWQEKILPDAALRPIRNDAEFKQLEDEYLRPR